MKALQFLMVFVLALLWISCESESDEPGPTDLQLAKLQNDGKAWIINGSSQSQVVKDNYDVSDQFEGFSLSFGEFTYSASKGLPHVWPASGTWSFENDKPDKILRNDGVSITVSETGDQLILTFISSGESLGGRINSVGGEFTFVLTSQ